MHSRCTSFLALGIILSNICSINKANALRIQVNTDHLEMEMSQVSQDDRTRIEILIEHAFPKAVEAWANALDVIQPVSNSGFLVDVEKCNEDVWIDIPYDDHSIGVYGTDLLIYAQSNCWSDSLGKGSFCQMDSTTNRPIVGSLTICLDHMELNDDGQMEDTDQELYVGVVMHEISHILGFTKESLPYFLQSDGVTPWGTTEKTVTCHDGDTRVENVPNILREQNGIWEIATPTVVQAVQNHFNCPSATGARLENQSSSSTCFLTHLDERYFFHDLMGPTIYFHNLLSPILLAVFEDSGWYNVDYTQAQVPSFGHGAGCSFLNEDCIVNNGDIPDYGRGFFCNDIWSMDSSPPRHCDATHTSIASCNLLENEEPSEGFQYFSDKNWGGSFSKADYCPMVIWWKDYCTSDQRCFDSNMGGICLPFECDSDKQKVSFTLLGDTYWCEEDFQIMTGTEIGNIECPRFASICPEDVCPKNCSGKGECNWDTGKCNCFDSNDTSAGCWMSTPALSNPNLGHSGNTNNSTGNSDNPDNGDQGGNNKKVRNTNTYFRCSSYLSVT